MAYRYGDDRNQTILFPESLDQYVLEDHPVRAYDAFVDALDFRLLGIDIDDCKVGNSQYDPHLMLKLLLYVYSYGIKSSRKLERELHNNLSFIWLMKNLKPDHKTIAEFPAEYFFFSGFHDIDSLGARAWRDAGCRFSQWTTSNHLKNSNKG